MDPLRILIVEDSKPRQELLARLVDGHHVDLVEAGEEAIQPLNDGDAYDIVFLDHDLASEKTGADVARVMTDYPGGDPLVIVQSMNPEGVRAILDELPAANAVSIENLDRRGATCHNSEDDVTLAATLTIPHGPGRHPSVVLISGSGPQDRDGTMVEHKPFLVLADYLARRGMASLRYDDRGTHESTGDFDTTTWEGFARDASAAVDVLEGHAQIDATRIGLVGHSEGGIVASMVAVSRSDVAFLVLLATTGVDGRVVLDSESEAMAMVRGDDAETRRFDGRIRGAMFDVVQNSPAGARLDQDLMQTLDHIVEAFPEQDREEMRAAAAMQNQMHLLTSPWFRYFLTHDPRPALTRITCPVLALHGEKDLQVLTGINLPEIERALRSGESEQVDVIELEGLNHLFQRCDTGLIGEYISIPETIDPLALRTIGDWIVTRTGPVGDEDY